MNSWTKRASGVVAVGLLLAATGCDAGSATAVAVGPENAATVAHAALIPTAAHRRRRRRLMIRIMSEHAVGVETFSLSSSDTPCGTTEGADAAASAPPVVVGRDQPSSASMGPRAK